MHTLTKIAALALVAVAASTSMSSAFFPKIPIFPILPKAPGISHNTDHTLECRVANGAFYVINFGNTQLESGRQVAWSSPETGDSGIVSVPTMVAPGDEIVLAELSVPVQAGAPCSVDFA